MNLKNNWYIKVINTTVIVFIIANLVFLNIWIFKNQEKQSAVIVSHSEQTDNETVCNEECVSQIYESIELATESSRTGSVIQNQNLNSSGELIEYFVPLGSGTSSSGTWADVPGALAYIDSSQYGTIQEVVFEASVFIPTGNQTAYVQLFNETAGHPVWFSEVSVSGGTPQLLISQPITLDPGNNLYQVQMMTSLQFQANLVQARVHITSLQ